MKKNCARIALITGMTGSGKTTLAKMFEGKGYVKVTMGDVVREMAKENNVEETSANLGVLAEKIREEQGAAAVARKCIATISEADDSMVVVDGIRSMEEVDAFREVSDAALVAIHASPKLRYRRLKKRNRTDDPEDWETFNKRDKRELGFGLGSSIALAEYMVINEGTFKDLEESFNELLDGMGDL